MLGLVGENEGLSMLVFRARCQRRLTHEVGEYLLAPTNCGLLGENCGAASCVNVPVRSQSIEIGLQVGLK